MSTPQQPVVNFSVKGEAPTAAAPAVFSNFLAVSRVGTEVQFEFVFLDLNVVATMIERANAAGITSGAEIEGKTVAKVVMPAVSFVQLHEQLEKIFVALKDILPKQMEVQHEHRSVG